MTITTLCALAGVLAVPTSALLALLFRTEQRITRLEAIIERMPHGG